MTYHQTFSVSIIHRRSRLCLRIMIHDHHDLFAMPVKFGDSFHSLQRIHVISLHADLML